MKTMNLIEDLPTTQDLINYINSLDGDTVNEIRAHTLVFRPPYEGFSSYVKSADLSQKEFQGHKRLTVFDVKIGDKAMLINFWDGVVYRPHLYETTVTNIYWNKGVTDFTDYYAL